MLHNSLAQHQNQNNSFWIWVLFDWTLIDFLLNNWGSSIMTPKNLLLVFFRIRIEWRYFALEKKIIVGSCKNFFVILQHSAEKRAMRLVWYMIKKIWKHVTWNTAFLEATPTFVVGYILAYNLLKKIHINNFNAKL